MDIVGSDKKMETSIEFGKMEFGKLSIDFFSNRVSASG